NCRHVTIASGLLRVDRACHYSRFFCRLPNARAARVLHCGLGLTRNHRVPRLYMIVLGFESSCDETGVAVVSTDRGLLAHALHSQVDMHQEYGGVVPEL